MPSNPVLQALERAWTTLQEAQAPMALMGGLALSMWEYVRATQDVDLLIAVGDADVDGLLKRMAAAGFRPKRTPPVMNLADVRLIQLYYEPPDSFLELQVDLLLADSEYHRTALSRRVTTRLPELGFDICVLSCEDLVLHKLLVDRILDRADCRALLVANRDRLDREYLRTWSSRLGLTQALSEAWESAFPGESFPAA